MNRHGHTRLAACALPLLLALAAQGGPRGDANAVGRGGEARMAQGVRSKRSKRLAGSWGGVGVRLEVGKGGAEVEFDCAHGALGPVAPDARGGFDVAGTFTRERGGPVREGEEEERLPARYHGRVEGDRMTLSVEAEGVEEVLTFTLARGSYGQLHKCM